MITITRIVHHDLPELSRLFEELSGKKTNFDLMVRNFECIQKSEDYVVLGARYGDKLVGSLMGIVCHDLVGECKPFMVIENVIVSDRFRGQGIGKKLMNEIEGIGRGKDCYYMVFVSGAQRKDAHKFYESLGYGLEEVQGFKKFLG